MAFREKELKKWNPMMASFIKKERPPEEVRAQVDLDYSIYDQSIEIFEIRPRWKDPDDTIKSPIAKTTWVRKQKVWKIYWQQADLKWHKYDPQPNVKTLEEFLKEVKEDPFACFWG